MKDNTNQILIDRFLSGLMTDEEKNDFQKALENNEELAQELAHTTEAHDLVKIAGRADLKKKLGAFETEYEPVKVRRIGARFKWMAAIAAVLVMGFGLSYLMLSQKPLDQALFAKYFEVYESPSVLRDVAPEGQANWAKGRQFYAENNFQKAILSFQQAEEEVPAYLIHFYLGVSYLSLSEPNFLPALENFERVLLVDNDYHQQVQWYKALALLRMGKKEMALQIFRFIVTNKSYHYQEAEEIIASLSIK